jgi:hypothetical protein
MMIFFQRPRASDLGLITLTAIGNTGACNCRSTVPIEFLDILALVSDHLRRLIIEKRSKFKGGMKWEILRSTFSFFRHVELKL